MSSWNGSRVLGRSIRIYSFSLRFIPSYTIYHPQRDGGCFCLYHKKDNLYGGYIASGALGIFVVDFVLYGISFDPLRFIRAYRGARNVTSLPPVKVQCLLWAMAIRRQVFNSPIQSVRSRAHFDTSPRGAFWLVTKQNWGR